ncbi:MAG: methyl-accepting chemotaxis protein [Thermodesulfobacteriota bacterium]
MASSSLSRFSVATRTVGAIFLVLALSLALSAVLVIGFATAEMERGYLQSVANLAHSLEQGTADSLERGQMKNFKELLASQRQIAGVLDVSLYDRQGRLNLSSSSEDVADKRLAEELWQAVQAERQPVTRQDAGAVRVLIPQFADGDCVRCHPGWAIGEIGGVLSVTCDLSGLRDSSRRLQRGLAAGALVLLLVTSGVLFLLLRRIVMAPLHGIITDLSQTAEEVDGTSRRVSEASQNLADAASRQAASLEETSSSLEELSAMTRRNADSAEMANTLVADSVEVVDAANRSLDQLDHGMFEITKASEETFKIAKAIDDIAFQTNLLALNAAVEAARAGEAGAGFAVVAGEVKSLASRSADAAKSSAQLIEGILAKIREGQDSAEATRKAFAEVTDRSGKIAGLIGEIAVASKEQASGLDLLNSTVLELDKLTQQSSTHAADSAAIAGEMEDQSGHLQAFIAELVSLVRGSRQT